MLSPLRQSPPSEVLASIEYRRASIQSKISGKKSVAESVLSDASSSLSHHSGEEKGTPGSKLAIREKVKKEKTHGEADPARSEPEQPEAPVPAPAPAPVPPVIPVSQSTYSFLTNLSDPKRPESWTDFQRGMEDIGFLASNAGGSIADFTGVDRKRVAFHKSPRPDDEAGGVYSEEY